VAPGFGDDLNLDATLAEGVDLLGLDGSAGEDEEVAIGRADELRVWRDAEMSVENDTQERPASRSLGAVGQERIVG
jgi:hypothetical protein